MNLTAQWRGKMNEWGKGKREQQKIPNRNMNNGEKTAIPCKWKQKKARVAILR